jgi:hypothetical protein
MGSLGDPICESLYVPNRTSADVAAAAASTTDVTTSPGTASHTCVGTIATDSRQSNRPMAMATPMPMGPEGRAAGQHTCSGKCTTVLTAHETVSTQCAVTGCFMPNPSPGHTFTSL